MDGADKVFRELFHSSTTAELVDADGSQWQCQVLAETRNDMRLQYTLQGQFNDYWEAAGIKSGDVLTFERNNPTYGKIRIRKYSQGRGLEAALSAVGNDGETATPGSKGAPCVDHVDARPPSSHALPTRTTSKAKAVPRAPPQAFNSHRSHRGAGPHSQPSSSSIPPQAQQVSHPNRWMESSDGSAVKNIYKSTLVHQQCPIAGWLFKKVDLGFRVTTFLCGIVYLFPSGKLTLFVFFVIAFYWQLYGRFPADMDQAPMHDPILGTDYSFEVIFISAANVHYIAVSVFITDWTSRVFHCLLQYKI